MKRIFLHLFLIAFVSRVMAQSSPSPIYTIEDLNDIRNDPTGNYVLMQDLDFSDADSYAGDMIELSYRPLNNSNPLAPGAMVVNDPSNGLNPGFVPIGDTTNPFTGTLDGNGFTVHNLYINSTAGYLGLFGVISAGSVVQNIGLVAAYVSGNGNGLIGPLAGFNNGGTVQGVHTGGIVSFTGENGGSLGGLIGRNAVGSIIRNSFSVANVTGTSTESGTQVGGLVGENAGMINNVYATGNVTGGSINESVGGLVGFNNGGTIQNSYATGRVSGGKDRGGLAGLTQLGNIKNSFFDIQTTDQSNALGNNKAGARTTTTLMNVAGKTTAQLKFFDGSDSIDTQTTKIGLSGYSVTTVTTYRSGLIEVVYDFIGAESQIGTDCDGDGLENTNILRRIVTFQTSQKQLILRETICMPIDKEYPDIMPLAPEEIAKRLQGGVSFSPEYIEDHGAIDSTREYSTIIGKDTINIYESGLVELIRSEKFRESQLARDYNNNGSRSDRVKIRKIFLDGYLYSEHIRVIVKDGGALEDFGNRIANAPQRIEMPDGIPSFLRFSGVIDDIKIHIAPTGVQGEYYLKIDNNNPSVQFIIMKQTSLGIEEIRSDHFDRAPLVESAHTYIIYAVEGPLYQATLSQYPNFYIRYDAINYPTPGLVQQALDKGKTIVENAYIPEFLNYYNAIRVEHDLYRRGSIYTAGKVILSHGHVYYSRPLIHEVAHGYHANFLPNGFNNEDIKSLYSMLPNRKSQRIYGKERNNYWRINHLEFFAEILTTYLYLRAEENVAYAITQVDSDFYYAHVKPYFDNLFGITD